MVKPIPYIEQNVLDFLSDTLLRNIDDKIELVHVVEEISEYNPEFINYIKILAARVYELILDGELELDVATYASNITVATSILTYKAIERQVLKDWGELDEIV